MTTTPPPASGAFDGPDRTVGHIRLGRSLGEGGMGTVYEGWDRKLERRVAVKAVARHTRDDREARARFLREARILSKLQHPNICQIHELLHGEDGGDYLVLELIEGRTLHDVLRDGRIGPRRAMEIARQLTEALIAAHDRGIVHRDLKPGNVMITSDGTVKVFDFGLALSADQAAGMVGPGGDAEGEPSTRREDPAGERDSDRGSSSDHPPELAGPSSVDRTGPVAFPDPAEPERTTDVRAPLTSATRASVLGTLAYMSPEQARSEPATAASDLYSLGLLLQEVFTGRSPRPAGVPIHLQLSRVGRGEREPIEGLEPELTRLIERLLALAPGARPTAVDVAERLRWIRDAPRRRARRVALAALVAGLGAVALVLGLQRARIAEEAARANREAQAAREVSDFLVDLFEVSDPWSAGAGDVTARQLLDRGAVRIRSELEGQPLTRARLLGTIGLVHRQLGIYDEARPLLEEALELARAEGAGGVDVAERLVALARLDTDQGELERAESRLLEAIELRRAALPEGHPGIAEAIHLVGYVRYLRGEFEEADRAYEESLAILRSAHGPRSEPVAEVLADRALLHQELGAEDRAEALHLEALEIRREILPAEHPALGISYANLAAHYYRTGRYSAARPLFERDLEIARRALGEEHHDVAISHNNLGTMLRDMGRVFEAEGHLMRSLEIRRSRLGDDHSSLGVAHHALGALYREMGRPEEAERHYLRSQEIWEATLEPGHPNLATSLGARGELYLMTDRPEDAEPLLERSCDIRGAHYGEDHRTTAEARWLLAVAHLRLGRLAEAEAGMGTVRDIAAAGLTEEPEHPRARFLQGRAALGLGWVARARGNLAGARREWERAREILEPLAAGTENALFDCAAVLALLELGELEAAAALARPLWEGGWRRPDLVTACRSRGLELG